MIVRKYAAKRLVYVCALGERERDVVDEPGEVTVGGFLHDRLPEFAQLAEQLRLGGDAELGFVVPFAREVRRKIKIQKKVDDCFFVDLKIAACLV